MLLRVFTALKAALKHGRDSDFVMWVIRLRVRFSACARTPSLEELTNPNQVAVGGAVSEEAYIQ
jgi:hypothetical protein